MRTYGGGDRGHFLEIACVPDATFKAEITALLAANTKVVGKLVSLTFANNYEVTSPASGAIPDGEIMTYEGDSIQGYVLGVRLFHYVDVNAGHHTPVCIKTLTYSGSVALQKSVVITGTTYIAVVDGSTGGWGAIISIDTTNSTVDVLC